MLSTMKAFNLHLETPVIILKLLNSLPSEFTFCSQIPELSNFEIFYFIQVYYPNFTSRNVKIIPGFLKF